MLADPALLEIQILEGEGDQHPVGTRTYKGIAIAVVDEQGTPVPNARVTFRMPATGPSGRFANGQAEESSTTDAKGRTAAWGIQWNNNPGECRVAILASAGKARAGTTASVILTGSAPIVVQPASFEVEAAQPPPAPAPARRKLEPKAEDLPAPAPEPARKPGVVLTRNDQGEEPIPNPRNKWKWIALGVGGAVGGGMLYYMLQSKASPGAAATTQTPAAVLNPTSTRPTIGAPTITIGKP